jgi:hypothetical protein
VQPVLGGGVPEALDAQHRLLRRAEHGELLAVKGALKAQQKVETWTRGRCYDHNFLRFSTIFGVFLKNQCYDNNFCKN